MPENLDDIRSALLVIGKALGVGFTVPPTNVAEDESILKPDGDRHYDRAEVIEIQLERIPPVEISNSNIDSMRDMFNRTHENYKAKWPKSLGTRYEASIENIASMPIFTWVFDSKLVNPRIELREYGYDENGYPYQLSQQHRNDLPWVSTCWTESLAIVSDGFSHVVNHPPWRGQRFGKEWIIPLEENLYPLEFLITHFQFHDIISPDYGPSDGFAMPPSSAGALLPSTFTQPSFWAHPQLVAQRWTKELPSSAESLTKHRTRVFLQYNFRVFTMHRLLETHVQQALPREHGTLPIAGSGPKGIRSAPPVTECRFAVALQTTCHLGLPVFTLMHLFDSARDHTPWLHMTDLSAADKWRSYGLRPCLFGTGFAIFVYRLYSWCIVWEKEWSSTLDGLDRMLPTELKDVLSAKSRKEIMFDSAGTDFTLSESYFAILQLLRIAVGWINESMDNLSQLRDDVSKTYLEHLRETTKDSKPEELHLAREVSEKNWDILLTHQRRLGDRLLVRIRMMEAKVKSLSDTLLSATSVREAVKSTELNHYVLVFTVVTIFYLPLGYVAALFALGMFSWDDSSQMRSFITTTLIVCLGTYAASTFLIWFVRKDERRRAFKSLIGYLNVGRGNMRERI